MNDLLRHGGVHRQLISPAWGAALFTGRGAARRLLAPFDADLEDVVAGAALRALADLARAGTGWADLRAVQAYARREAHSAALNLIRRRRGRARSRRRRADPLVYAERLGGDASTKAQESGGEDDLLVEVLLAATGLPPAQRAAVAGFLVRSADLDRPAASPAERKAWSRARAALRARLHPEP